MSLVTDLLKEVERESIHNYKFKLKKRIEEELKKDLSGEGYTYTYAMNWFIKLLEEQ